MKLNFNPSIFTKQNVSQTPLKKAFSSAFSTTFRGEDIYGDDSREIYRQGVLLKSDINKGKTEVQKAFNRAIADGSLKKSFTNVDFERYQKGFPLDYERKDFIKDIKNVTATLKEDEKRELFDFLGFKIDENNDIIGIPSIKKEEIDTLSANLKEALNTINPLVDSFLNKNHININDNEELSKTLNLIAKTFPELFSIIGKKQHGTQVFSVDTHTMKVLQGCVQNPKYDELDDNDKKILTISVLFHDFAKKEGIVHHSHPQESAEDAKKIIKKLDLSGLDQKRIFNLINHSHWLQELSEGDVTHKDLAKIFSYPNDFKMAKIFEEADLKGIRPGFFDYFESTLIMDSAKVDKELEQIRLQKQCSDSVSTFLPGNRDFGFADFS